MYYNKYRLLFTGAGSYDADAQAYFTAAGITDAGHKSAWNTFVLDCKANGNWTPLIAAYPVIGGTSGTHAINAKTPGTYNLTFSGITHSSSGIQGNGTSNNVNTGIQPSTAFGSNIGIHLCFYSPTVTLSGTAVETDMGCFNSTTTFLVSEVYKPLNYTIQGGVFNASVSGSAASMGGANGVWIIENPSSITVNFYRNGSSVGSATNAKSALASLTGTIRLTCRANNAGTVSRRTSKTYGFFSIGTTLGNVAAFSAAIATLQAALGR